MEMRYDSDHAHCAGIDEQKSYCPLKDCYRYRLHSERCRMRNNGSLRFQPAKLVAYVPMSYKQGKCEFYEPTK